MNTQSSWKTFLGFALRVILAHTLTYFLFGMIGQLGHPCELTRWYQMDIVEPRPKKRFAVLQPIL